MSHTLELLGLSMILAIGACGESGPPLITFDGGTCAVTDGSGIPSGLAQVQVHNTGSNAGEAFLLKLTDAYTLEDLHADADAGRYDRFRLEGNDDPTGFDDFQAARFPASMDEPLTQPFTASPGTWGVVCSDFLEQRSFAAAEVLEVD